MEVVKKPKWEAAVSAVIAGAKADQIWPLVRDFFGIYKYFPIIGTTSGIQGNNGEVGSIRHNEGVEESVDEDGKPFSFVRWTKERILAIDQAERTLTYDLVDSNTVFKSYVATMKVSESESGCVLQWSFSVDPVEGFEFDLVLQLYQIWVKAIAENMEKSALSD